ncbi:hypothetical protein L484_016133 [Morus notabilis]|uniref:Uncharacterized protein n=1 Tax=Morus notabilis TaxID=981085 RepID=W9QBN7_9ROSA|nr:hypothetical protein L484_016133 [Morus notabilis]
MVITARYLTVEGELEELRKSRDSLKELLIKVKDKARTRDEEMLDLRAQLESSDEKVAAKDLQIRELSDLVDEWYTNGWASQCPSQLSKGQIARPMSITAVEVLDCLEMHGLSRNPPGIVLCKAKMSF